MSVDPARLTSAVAEWAGLGAALLDRCRRADLAQLARSLERRVGNDATRVLVVGDFKQGKSTLVNAVVGTAVCSTAPTVPTAVPTVCCHAEVRDTAIVERRGGEFRRRAVTDLEAQAAQEGQWPEALTVELALDAPALAAGLEIVDCPPASGRSATRAAVLDAARSADVVCFVTDTTQSLTEPEVALLTELAAMLPTMLVLTKCDLVPGWRKVVVADGEVVERLGLDCPVTPVAARLHDPLVTAAENADSGIESLLVAVRERAASARLERLEVAYDLLVSTLEEARRAQLADLDALGDRESLRDAVRRAEAELERVRALRTPTAGWQRVLDARLEDAEAALLETANAGLAALRERARSTLGEINPAKDWETFEPWLRTEAGELTTTVINEAQRRVEAVAAEVTHSFADGDVRLSPEFQRTVSEVALTRVQDDAIERRSTKSIREGVATLGSTSGGVVAIAAIAGIAGLPITVPMAAVVGVGFSGTTILADLRGDRAAKRDRAMETVEQYIASVTSELADTVHAGLADFRTRTVDTLIARSEQLVVSAQDQVDSTREVLQDAELARERLVGVAGNVDDLDDLLGRIRRRREALAAGDS